MTRVTWILLFSGMLLAGFPFLLISTWGHGIPWVLALACLLVGLFGIYAAYAVTHQKTRKARGPQKRTFR